jgi:hypothetical protein
MMIRLSSLAAAAIVLGLGASAPVAGQALSSESAPSAGWTVTPGLLVNSSWDDNALARGRHDQTPADLINILSPRLNVDFRGRRGQIDADYEGAIRLYRELTSLNSYDHRGSFSARVLASRHVTLFARESITQAPTTELIELIGVPYVRTGSTSQYLQGGVEAALSKRTTVGGAYNFQLVRFGDSTLLAFPLRGGHSHGGQATVRHALTERTAIIGEYANQYAWVGTSGEMFVVQRGDTGIEHQITPNARIFGAFGFAHLNVTTAGPARTGPSWRAGFRQEFEPATLDVAYSRSFVPSYGFGGGTQQNEEFSVSGLAPLSRNVYTQGAFLWRINEPLTIGGLKLHSWYLRSAVGYAMAPWARLEGFYDMTSQAIDRPGGDLGRRRIGAQIITNKPMRIR